MKDRDDFSAEVKDKLARRVGFHCSNPKCKKVTSGPQIDAAKAINLGIAAHITAAAPGGPRYNADLTPEQRTAIDNGIWLCWNCSHLIDSDIKRYPANLLRQWKQDAEARALAELEGNPAGPDAPLPAKPQTVYVDPATIQIDPDNPPVAAIRDLLEAAFTANSLLRFCKNQEEFQPVVKSFGPGHGLEDMVDELIDYCGTRLLWDTLLAKVAEVNKKQFDKFVAQLRA
jgi:hypothetical protein